MWGIPADAGQWIVFLGAILIAVGAALVVHAVLVRVLAGLAKRTASSVDDLLIHHLRRPLRWVLVLIAAHLAIEPLDLPPGVGALAGQVFGILLIVMIVWLLIKLVYVLGDVVLLRFRANAADDLRIRAVSTQVAILRHIAVAVIVAVGLATILMTFDRVRQLGAAMLASAGIAGIILGFAAQKTLGNLIAGLQIAFTQPLRIDDAVIVENEFGRIEEITLTYVVVKVWDLRRLIVPITYFVEHPFQNWTRQSANLMGSVLLYVDYSVPVEAVRAELKRILEGTDLWDRKVGQLQVTNTSERTIELRALVSAADSGAAWDLRCHVRERLLEFIRQRYPYALPRLRTQFEESENRRGDDA